MKTEFAGLRSGQLKPGDHQGQVRRALDEGRKPDPKWMSVWATRKVLDKSIWFGAWRGLISQISRAEEGALYSRFTTEVVDQGEQQRIVSVLASVMDAALAARVFARACEIRTKLSFPPGYDQVKWNLLRQPEHLLRAIRPAMPLDGTSEKLDNDPDGTRSETLRAHHVN